MPIPVMHFKRDPPSSTSDVHCPMYKFSPLFCDTQLTDAKGRTVTWDSEDYVEHRSKMPWLALPFGDPLVEKFKSHYRVMNPTEVPRYGYGPRSGVPALLIIGSDGKLQQQLDLHEEGTKILRKWDAVSNRF